MKIAITTDTHYGYDHNTHKIHVKFLNRLQLACEENNVDALIHCGDWISHNQHQLPRTWRMFRNALGDLPILAVKGNHDLWDWDYWGVPAKKRKWARHPAGMTHEAMIKQHQEWADEHNIHLLQKNPYRHDDFGEDDTIIYGFNGWYHHPNPGTNDAKYMARVHQSAPLGVYLNNEAHKNLEWCLNEVEYKKCENENIKTICVTHMPFHSEDKRHIGFCANPRYLEFVAEKFDYLLVGHSHQTEDFVHNCEIYHEDQETAENYSIRVINAGTDFDEKSGGYNNPNFVVVEV